MATVRTVKKLMLGREIAHMIETAGLSQAQAGALIEVGQSRIAGLIKGEGRISTGDLIMLANKLGFTDDGYHQFLLDLRRDNHKRGFWSTGYYRAYDEDLRLLVDLENNADEICVVELEVIPGLAQCAAYVRALNEDLEADDLVINDLVKARLARQDIYEKKDPPQVNFVLSESCLRRAWAGPVVMHQQLEYLIELSHRPNVTLQIMPFDISPGRPSPMPFFPFNILRVPSSGAAGPLKLVYTEGEEELRYLDGKNALNAYSNAWKRATSAALNADESRKFIRAVADNYFSDKK